MNHRPRRQHNAAAGAILTCLLGVALTAPTVVWAVNVSQLGESRLTGELALRVAAVRAQVSAVDCRDHDRRLEQLLDLLQRHGVLRDDEDRSATRSRLCGGLETQAVFAACWVDALVCAQDALIDGARLGAARQPLAPHRKHLNAKEKEALHSQAMRRRVRAIAQVVAALRPSDRSIAEHVSGWLDAAGPGRWSMYRGLVAGLQRYRDLASQTSPALAADFPIAAADAWRSSKAKRDWHRRLTPRHRRQLQQRLCHEGYCPPAVVLTDSAAPAPTKKALGAAAPLDEGLASSLRAWQHDRGLRPAALVDQATAAALRVPMASRVDQILLSLQRIRDTGVAPSESFLVANIPAFRVDVWRDGKLARSHKTQVGKGSRRVRRNGRLVRIAGMRTPLMSTKLRYLVLNPEWVVPSSIRREYRRKVRDDPNWFANNGFEQRTSSNGGESLVMKSGPKNLLGVVKFMFPNQHLVYLHDTSSQAAFRLPVRLKSHGCVRVQDAPELARDLLGYDRGRRVTDRQWSELMEGAVDKWISLRRPPDIHLVYWTADVSQQGKVRFYPDPYGYDDLDEATAQQVAMARFDGLPAAPGHIPAGPAEPDCPGGHLGPDGDCPTR